MVCGQYLNFSIYFLILKMVPVAFRPNIQSICEDELYTSWNGTNVDPLCEEGEEEKKEGNRKKTVFAVCKVQGRTGWEDFKNCAVFVKGRRERKIQLGESLL